MSTPHEDLWSPEEEKKCENQFNRADTDSNGQSPCVQYLYDDLHVLDGTTEGVGDCAVVDRLFAKTKVCQLHMPC